MLHTTKNLRPSFCGIIIAPLNVTPVPAVTVIASAASAVLSTKNSKLEPISASWIAATKFAAVSVTSDLSAPAGSLLINPPHICAAVYVATPAVVMVVTVVVLEKLPCTIKSSAITVSPDP